MNKKDIVRSYTERVEELQKSIARLNGFEYYFISSEILFFIGFLGTLIAGLLQGRLVPWIPVALVLLVGYLLIRHKDGLISSRKHKEQRLCTTYQRELAYHNGDWERKANGHSLFDNGARFVNESHPYTFNLDIFGNESLYHRMARTVTTGGSETLARWLEKPCLSKEHIAQRRATLCELSKPQYTSWRMRFQSIGIEEKIDTQAILAAEEQLKRFTPPRYSLSSILFSFLFLAETGFIGLLMGFVAGWIPFQMVSAWAFLQLLVSLGLCTKPLQRYHQILGTLQSQTVWLVELLHIAAERKDAQSLELRQNLLEVKSSLQAFQDLEHLLNRLDRRGNLLALLFCNALFFNDVFLLRKIVLWQKENNARFSSWLSAINQLDAWVSMATFTYNEPDTSQAQIVDSPDILYQAKALCHPFLGNKAVPNDVDIAHQCFYIITGANMAGKSTFLRTVGINYVLVLCGLPVFAQSMKVSLFSLFTGMRTTDDLTHGISFFNAELLRLKQLLDYCDKHRPTLIILDEILKGTNSEDKLNGSRMFLEHMAQKNVSGIVATHDLELSHMAEQHPQQFFNYCFEIELSDKVTYSYRITLGVARNQNATFLLKQLLNTTGC